MPEPLEKVSGWANEAGVFLLWGKAGTANSALRAEPEAGLESEEDEA